MLLRVTTEFLARLSALLYVYVAAFTRNPIYAWDILIYPVLSRPQHLYSSSFWDMNRSDIMIFSHKSTDFKNLPFKA
jgi:hypothetical protein